MTVHNHPPYRPMCNERTVDGQLRGACLTDDGQPANPESRATDRDYLTEKHADRPARAYLDPLHDELDRLRTENADLTQELATVRDTLRHRSNALNATGTHNDQLRAQLAEVERAAVAWRKKSDRIVADGDSDAKAMVTAGALYGASNRLLDILADKEPTP